MKRSYKYWTTKEIQFLIKNAAELTDGEIANELGRSIGTIRAKRWSLGIITDKNKPKGIYEVKKGYEVLAVGTLEECAEELGVTVGTMNNYAKPSFWKRYKNLDKCTVAIRVA